MTIVPYSTQYRHALSDLMVSYMAELNCGIPEDIIRGKLADLIDRQCREKIICADIAMEEQTMAGFSIYQLDTETSDWCKRPGWGFIREFYITPPVRKQGFGRILAEHTEAQLRSLGADRLYLTSDDAIPFWQCCDWKLTEELCSNGQYILEK